MIKNTDAWIDILQDMSKDLYTILESNPRYSNSIENIEKLSDNNDDISEEVNSIITVSSETAYVMGIQTGINIILTMQDKNFVKNLINEINC